jgi:ATP-binding cassette subfamily F protein 3
MRFNGVAAGLIFFFPPLDFHIFPSMISVANVSLQFGGKILFHEISFRVGPRDRIGLVGSNGTGKSTLLRLLLGEQSPDSGEIAKAKFVNVGYLPQEGMFASGKTLLAEAESVFRDVVLIQENLREIHRRMEEVDHQSAEFNELLTLYGELQHRLEDADAFRIRSRAEKVLTGLGFRQTDFHRLTDEFSGGWQMRIALAKLLLLQPSLLLLDEPTNHLDLDSLQWLEEYLRSYDGAVIIVSHDSRFLDTMVSKTFELSLGTLSEYPGNYTFYLKAKLERREQERAAYENQQKRIRQTMRFVERFRYKATKARQVQSRLKALEKMDLIEREDDEGEIRFSFPPAPQSGRSVLELRGIRKAFDGVPVFEGIDFDIDRGDRIAFVGMNGAGKSTLSRIVAGTEPVDAGERRVGHNVLIAYFAQHQAEELDPRKDVLGTLDEVAIGDIRKRLRALLGRFLFRGDDVFKSVGVLSGGEKSRLALAKLLLQPSNLIVLDEPTNHLDMRSKAVLLEALLDYEGSFVIVSHDRDFLDPLVNRVVEFRDGRIRTFPGNVSEYLERAALDHEAGKAGRENDSLRQSVRERKRAEAEERQRRYQKIRPLRKKVEEIEKVIEERERTKKELEQTMADPGFYLDGETVRDVTARYKALEKELTEAYYRWNDLTKELEEADRTEG